MALMVYLPDGLSASVSTASGAYARVRCCFGGISRTAHLMDR
jgi:hypothetical protein